MIWLSKVWRQVIPGHEEEIRISALDAPGKLSMILMLLVSLGEIKRLIETTEDRKVKVYQYYINDTAKVFVDSFLEIIKKHRKRTVDGPGNEWIKENLEGYEVSGTVEVSLSLATFMASVIQFNKVRRGVDREDIYSLGFLFNDRKLAVSSELSMYSS